MKIHLNISSVKWQSFCPEGDELTHWDLMMPCGDRDLGQQCCLTAPSRYLNQCWLIVKKVQWYSSEDNFRIDISATSQWNKLENYLYKIPLKSPRGQWVINMSLFPYHGVQIQCTHAFTGSVVMACSCICTFWCNAGHNPLHTQSHLLWLPVHVAILVGPLHSQSCKQTSHHT